MKKQLLLAMTVVSVATVNAQQLAKRVIDSHSDAVATQNTEVSSAVLESVSNFVKAPVSAPALAEGDDYTPVPFYTVSGLFYDNVIINGEYSGYTYNGKYGYLPPFAQLTYNGGKSYYAGTPTGDFVWGWSVPEISEVDLDAESVKYYERTGDAMVYTASFATKFVPWPVSVPATLDMDGVTYAVGNTFTSGGNTYTAQGFQYGGLRGTADELISLTYYPNAEIQAYTALTSDYAVCNRLCITNWILGDNWFTDADSPLSTALLLEPAADGSVYGFDQVTLVAYVNTLTAGGKFKLEVYEYSEDNDAQYWSQVYVPGKLVASGYVATDAYAGSTGTTVISVPVIDVEGEGDDAVENPSFYNVTKPVMVVISFEKAAGAEGDQVLPLPVFAKGANSSRMWTFGKGGQFFKNMDMGDGSEPKDYFYPFWTSNKTIGGAALRPIGWDMGFSLQYSYLFNDGSHPELSFDAPAAGGSKDFVFTPLIDLYEAKVTISNNEDWLFVYPDAELQADGTQKLIVEVDALPSGVNGRAAVVTVEIKGAVQTITVTQGDTSGIDSVNGDAAEVVSSQIFDLQGRQLNVVPESGLYIRRDVKADNTVSTVKVVK